MKIGIDEFRSRLREVAEAHRSIAVVEAGKVVGHYLPTSEASPDTLDIEGWADARRRFRERWIAETPDWRERLSRYGLDEDGEPFGLELPRFPL